MIPQVLILFLITYFYSSRGTSSYITMITGLFFTNLVTYDLAYQLCRRVHNFHWRVVWKSAKVLTLHTNLGIITHVVVSQFCHDAKQYSLVTFSTWKLPTNTCVLLWYFTSDTTETIWNISASNIRYFSIYPHTNTSLIY